MHPFVVLALAVLTAGVFAVLLGRAYARKEALPAFSAHWTGRWKSDGRWDDYEIICISSRGDRLLACGSHHRSVNTVQVFWLVADFGGIHSVTEEIGLSEPEHDVIFKETQRAHKDREARELRQRKSAAMALASSIHFPGPGAVTVVKCQEREGNLKVIEEPLAAEEEVHGR